ncbi:hypothetical protein [Actinacidiphila glaucinigra]|uniref:hypothetical protein n=1 Tax=Actinacidiphila glaucinigra TaxID=235986 RepID=UPI00366E939C
MEARTDSRTGVVIATIVGLVVLATLTAGAVVAFGSSSSSPSASALPGGAAPSSRDPETADPATPSPTASPSTGPTSTPSPTRTLRGTVDDGRHRGDLRYFLLAPPADAEIYGDEEGTELSRSEVADSADVKQALATHGFKAAAQRTYLTGDGDYEVSAQLVRFANEGSATAYYNAFYYQGTRITLPSSGSPAKAYRLSSSSAESTGSVIVLSHQGDVHITLSVTGAKTPGKDLLARLLDKQYRRLKTGR